MTDVDECTESGKQLCEDRCINTEGSYYCFCTDPGYKLSWDDSSCSGLSLSLSQYDDLATREAQANVYRGITLISLLVICQISMSVWRERMNVRTTVSMCMALIVASALSKATPSALMDTLVKVINECIFKL